MYVAERRTLLRNEHLHEGARVVSIGLCDLRGGRRRELLKQGVHFIIFNQDQLQAPRLYLAGCHSLLQNQLN